MTVQEERDTMPPTPAPSAPLRRTPRPAGTDAPWEYHRVRPLPPTEPGAGGGPGATVQHTGGWHRPVPTEAVPVRAQRAAHTVIRMALEVIDRRRPPHQTRGAFPAHLGEMLQTLAREGVPGRGLGPARIHRLHISAVGPGGGADAGSETGDYEVCATYARGPRLFAVAARIRVTPTGATCTALRLA